MRMNPAEWKKRSVFELRINAKFPEVNLAQIEISRHLTKLRTSVGKKAVQACAISHGGKFAENSTRSASVE